MFVLVCFVSFVTSINLKAEPEPGLGASLFLGRCTQETFVGSLGSDTRGERQPRGCAHRVIIELIWAPFHWHLLRRRLRPPALLPECAKLESSDLAPYPRLNIAAPLHSWALLDCAR